MGELATSLLSCADWGTSYGADFENLTFTSTSELTKANSNNFGFVVINAIYTDNGDPATYNFKDITVNVNLQNAGTCTGAVSYTHLDVYKRQSARSPRALRIPPSVPI